MTSKQRREARQLVKLVKAFYLSTRTVKIIQKEKHMTRTQILNQLIKKICFDEKGKKQLNAPQSREVVKVIAKRMTKDQEFVDLWNEYLEGK